MKNKIIAFSNNFIPEAIKRFFKEYKLEFVQKLNDNIEYTVLDKEGNPLFEKFGNLPGKKSIINIMYEKDKRVFFVSSFYPNLIYQSNYQKGDSAAAFYLAIAHFAKYYNLPNNTFGEILSYSDVYNKFYGKMKDLNFAFQYDLLYKDDIFLNKYRFILPSFHINISQLKEKKKIDIKDNNYYDDYSNVFYPIYKYISNWDSYKNKN